MRNRGLTLIELMMGLAVLGLLIGLATVSLQSSISRGRVSTAVREVYAQAIKARQAARASNLPVRFDVRPGTIDGRDVQIVRWEVLPCGPWGLSCPIDECKAKACSTEKEPTSCECVEIGTPVAFPKKNDRLENLNLSDLHDLCFAAGSAKPLKRDCQTEHLDNFKIALGKVAEKKTEHLLVADGLTGLPRLVDCAGVNPDPDFCSGP